MSNTLKSTAIAIAVSIIVAVVVGGYFFWLTTVDTDEKHLETMVTLDALRKELSELQNNSDSDPKEIEKLQNQIDERTKTSEGTVTPPPIQCTTNEILVAGKCVDKPTPPPDSDGDGILDGVDRCQNLPENYNNFEDTDGCPDTPPDPPVPCIEEGKSKPSIRFIEPEDGIEISKTNVYVKVRAQTDEFGIDYIGVALNGVNIASISPGLDDCELSVDIKDLKEGGNTIYAAVWGTSPDKGNPISTQIIVYVNTK